MYFHDTEFIIYGKTFKIKANYIKNELEIKHNGFTVSTSFKSIRDADYLGTRMCLNLCGDDFKGRNEYLKKLIAITTLELIKKLNLDLEMLCIALASNKLYG